jgi:N-acetyl-anhydromuramyl-L-alanine amidase AmpD
MKKFILLNVFISFSLFSYNQQEINYSAYFTEAYLAYPDIPKGYLEAIAWANTHIDHKTTENTKPSDMGMPFGWTCFYLVEDGKGWFKNNLKTISTLSGIPVETIKWNPRMAIMAYAKAYHELIQQKNIHSVSLKDHIPILKELTYLPEDPTYATLDFAFYSYVYELVQFLNNTDHQQKFHFPAYQIDLKEIVGANNAKVLTSPKVQISKHGITTEDHTTYQPLSKAACPDYNVSWCSWVASPNFSSRNGTAITNVIMHTVQGSYAGCISWFQNTSAQASTHYVVRSSDGQLTQMVLESDKAWHVGSENPYTVGYEHEGYVEQNTWYTMPMYQRSADLTRDICQAYGINTHRMFYRDTLDDGTALDYGLHVLAGSSYCTKISGHQHLPNQTHTDPGPYWTWDTYYKLVNNNPTITTLTAASGTFYDSGGASGNYGDDERKVWVIQPTGASQVTLTFTSFNVEANYDFMYIYDGPSVWSPRIGRYNTQSPGTITSTGGALTIEFRSDCATNAAGWAANWSSVSPDNVAPTTSISTTGNWKTQDFTADFNDNDNIAVEKSFYQVLDFDGQYWGANTNRGFFGDNFDILQPHWNIYAGTWTANNGELTQTDENATNSNIYAALNQTLSNRYLYQFRAKVSGSGSNKRFGFHFFCDDANYTNRHNSYFIWFRVEDQQLQFYKVVNDTFTLQNTVSNVVTNTGQWYDFKITYDRVTGRIAVWRDNVYMGSWTDPSPYSTNGNYISFRTGNAALNVDELKVYRSRYPQVTVTMGDNTKDIRYQNPNPSTFGAKIKSIVVDANNNLSSIAYHDLNVDWTPPQVFTINDGVSTDVDTVYSNSTVFANWQAAIDPNSGIQEYFYALGTTQGGTDIINWTSTGQNTSITINGLNLTFGNTYYFSMKAVNYAGLTSSVISSDGFTVSSLNYPMANFSTVEDTVYLPNATVLFINQSQNATSYLWDFGDGGSSTQVNPWHQYTQTGTYTVSLIAMNPPLPNDTLVMTNYITVLNGQHAPSATIATHLYPNPFNETIYLTFSTDFSGTIEIQDLSGKSLAQKTIVDKPSFEFTGLKSLSKGTYLLKLFDVKHHLLLTQLVIKE